MTDIVESINHEITTKELLQQILEKLSIIVLHQEKASNEVFKSEDIDNGTD